MLAKRFRDHTYLALRIHKEEMSLESEELEDCLATVVFSQRSLCDNDLLKPCYIPRERALFPPLPLPLLPENEEVLLLLLLPCLLPDIQS